MREFVANFQKKHGQQVPMPKIYGDEDSDDDEGLELADFTKVGKKATGSARDGSGPSTSGDGTGRSGGRKRGRDNDDDDDDPNKHRKMGDEGKQPLRPLVARKEPRKKGTAYPRSTGSYQPSTSLDLRREPCWATACWTGLRSRRGRYMRRGCRGD